MNKTVRKMALVSVAAGSFALSGCSGSNGSGSYVKGINPGTSETVYILARSSQPEVCTVIVAKTATENITGSIFPGNIISDPVEVKSILEGNKAALKAALINNSAEIYECKPNDKIKVLIEQDLSDFQRK
jgi:hypothetical protein